ncbi:MAG: hypothetical protein ACM3U0_02295 [archaeon]
MATHFSDEKVKFRILLNAGLYMPGRIVPSEVRLYGDGHFIFKATEKPEVLNVRIADIYLHMLPAILELDLNHDGVLESMEIREVDLSKFVNYNSTSGKLNVETGEFQLDWVFDIGPETHPLLRETMSVVVQDRGVFDFRTGEFEIHRGMFRIDKFPLEGALIRGSAHGCAGMNAIYLAVAVAGTNFNCAASLDIKKPRQKEVWVCPRDHIELCWRTLRNTCDGDTHDRIRIDPGGIEIKLPNNNYLLEVPSNYASNPIKYTATVLDPSGKDLASDIISVNIYEGEWIYLNAQPDPVFNRWTLQIPPQSHSASIYIDTIQLIKNVRDCLAWDNFAVEHTSPSYPGSSILATTLGNDSETKISPAQQIIGNWFFYGIDKLDGNGKVTEQAPHPNDYKSPICFRVRGSCRK